MKNKMYLFYLLTLLGIVLVCTGGFVKSINGKNISGPIIGIGAGLFGMSVGSIFNLKIEKKCPEVFQKKNIEVNDERNIVIRDKAGSRTNQIMGYVIYLITLSLSLMNVSMYIIFFMVGLIVFRLVLMIVYTNHYNKII
ncbi:MAG: hypothetical protein Q8920_14360 [Bacillota bacterium]|nr:hypothetical protein [Bacillota bacterium]